MNKQKKILLIGILWKKEEGKEDWIKLKGIKNIKNHFVLKIILLGIYFVKANNNLYLEFLSNNFNIYIDFLYL